MPVAAKARETLQATDCSLASPSLSPFRHLAEYYVILRINRCVSCLLNPSPLLTTGFEADFLTYCPQRNVPARASLCPCTMNETQDINLIFLRWSYLGVPCALWSLLEPTDPNRLPDYDVSGKRFIINLDFFFLIFSRLILAGVAVFHVHLPGFGLKEHNLR